MSLRAHRRGARLAAGLEQGAGSSISAPTTRATYPSDLGLSAHHESGGDRTSTVILPRAAGLVIWEAELDRNHRLLLPIGLMDTGLGLPQRSGGASFWNKITVKEPSGMPIFGSRGDLPIVSTWKLDTHLSLTTPRRPTFRS